MLVEEIEEDIVGPAGREQAAEECVQGEKPRHIEAAELDRHQHERGHHRLPASVVLDEGTQLQHPQTNQTRRPINANPRSRYTQGPEGVL